LGRCKPILVLATWELKSCRSPGGRGKEKRQKARAGGQRQAKPPGSVTKKADYEWQGKGSVAAPVGIQTTLFNDSVREEKEGGWEWGGRNIGTTDEGLRGYYSLTLSTLTYHHMHRQSIEKLGGGRLMS